MRFNKLNDWLRWQESLNPKQIDLGLDRVASVLSRAGLSAVFACPVIIVAGTNGKGSVVAMIEAIAMQTKLKVCSYTSPHLLQYNERICINHRPVDDKSLCEAFERIDQARGELALTYFEFGTLAALDLFQRADADLVVLEVGLGGRLDAVNVVQPSVSVITSIDIDHTDWLGNNRDSIAREKAGIFRPGVPAICGDSQPPSTLYQQAEKTGADLCVIQHDYHYQADENNWQLQSPFGELENLPFPSLAGTYQIANAATAIVALQALNNIIDHNKMCLSTQTVATGLRQCRVRARFETLHIAPLIQLDVAHNPLAAHALASQLERTDERNSSGKCYGLIAMLEDKDVETVAEILAEYIDEWIIAGLPGIGRGLTADALQKRIQSRLVNAKLHTVDTVKQACKELMHRLKASDRAIIFGSFYTASEAIEYFENNDTLPH